VHSALRDESPSFNHALLDFLEGRGREGDFLAVERNFPLAATILRFIFLPERLTVAAAFLADLGTTFRALCSIPFFTFDSLETFAAFFTG